MPEIDDRLVRISVEINGQLKRFEGLALVARGTKYANANQNDCEVVVTNLTSISRDYLLTETSPFNANRTPKRFIVEAGRKSYGFAKIFEGTIASATPSQPPDIALTIKALTGNDAKGNVIARSQPSQVSLSQVSQQVANDLGASLVFEATDKKLANYNFTGGALKQIDALGAAGNVNAFLDDGTLIVKDQSEALSGTARVLDMDSGLIGIPEITEHGVKVKYLLDNTSRLGGLLRVRSRLNPAATGDYVIYKLGFDIASRDTPFYWIAEARRI